MYAQVATFTPKLEHVKDLVAELRQVKTGAGVGGLKHLFVLRHTRRRNVTVIGLFEDKKSLDQFAESTEVKKLMGSSKAHAESDVELYEVDAEVI
jgi:hypothetical protein